MKQPKQALPYYGAKSKIAKYYPNPIHEVIIEPFAGGAAYSQRHWRKKVLLIDAYLPIVQTWEFLIKSSERDILNLPDVDRETRVFDLDIPVGARYLIGFHINRASISPKNVPTTRCIPGWNRGKHELAKIVHHFDHWNVLLASYVHTVDWQNEATWYVDPPYEFGGEHYVKSDIDYDQLATFCKTRKGQVIVCENTRATWLPFVPLIDCNGMRHKTTESIWLDAGHTH